MGRFEDAPYTRGGSQFNGGFIPATLATGEGSPAFNIWGKEYVFEDEAYGTGMYVHLTVVNNSGTYNLKPGQLVAYSTANVDFWGQACQYGQAVNALANAAEEFVFPVDEFGPPAGFPPGDSFYIVTQGPALLPVTSAGVAISIGNPVISAGGSTTGDGIEGTITVQVLGGATTVLANNVQNRVGRAMSSCASVTTPTTILVRVGW